MKKVVITHSRLYENDKPGKLNRPFIIEMESDMFLDEGVLLVTGIHKVRITTNAKRKWYLLLLQKVTLGRYRAPFFFEAEMYPNDEYELKDSKKNKQKQNANGSERANAIRPDGEQPISEPHREVQHREAEE